MCDGVVLTTADGDDFVLFLCGFFLLVLRPVFLFQVFSRCFEGKKVLGVELFCDT